MKRTLVRLSVMLLAAALIALPLSACQTAAPAATSAPAAPSQAPEATATEQPAPTPAPTPTPIPTPDVSKSVELSMYLVGEAPTGFEEMTAALNAMLQKDINATIKFNNLAWGDYDKKYPLLLSSGEAFDLIYSATWINFAGQAQKGGFLALDDLLPQYAPKLQASLPQAAWDQCRVNGKIYMVPASDVGLVEGGVLVRGDLMKKYNIPDIKDAATFQAYLDAVKANEPSIVPLNLAGTRAEVAALPGLFPPDDGPYAGGFGLGLNILGFQSDPSNVFCWYLTPNYESYCKTIKTWADKGYWSKSMLSNKVSMGDAFVNGTSAACITNIIDASAKYTSITKDHPDWLPTYYELYPDIPKYRDVYPGNGASIGASSKNPERAMMFLELVNTNEAYHDVTFYGVKGTNYDLDSNGKRIAVGGNPMYSGEDTSVWGWGNPKFTKFPANIMPGYQDILANVAAKAIDSPYASFVLNTDNIKTELAALTNVRDQYATPLTAGMVDDVDASLKQLRDQLQAAGIDKVLTEVKTQVAAYLAAQK